MTWYPLLYLFVCLFVCLLAGERRKLLLQPRSKPLEGGEGGGAGGSSIFGGAKPVDTASREKEIEERLIKRKEESIEVCF